jgi:hypothetical protein
MALLMWNHRRILHQARRWEHDTQTDTLDDTDTVYLVPVEWEEPESTAEMLGV